jgi:beta-lactamase superfamily II metal-dependent hydrolase
MSLGERWFLLILVELLTITQWVKMRGDFYWYWWNFWPSLNELRWEVIFIDIGGKQFHQYQQKSPLTSTHWMMVNNSTNINKNHLSPKLIEWWSTIPSISTKITSHLNFYWYWWNCWPSLNELRWEVVLADIGGIVDHQSMSWGERWFLLILVELLISTKITSHFNSLNDGQQFHQYQQKSPLT